VRPDIALSPPVQLLFHHFSEAFMRFVTNWKTAVLLALTCAGTVNAGGCTDRDVAIIAGTALVTSVLTNPPPASCEFEERKCWPVKNRYGYVVGEECRMRTRSCNRYRKMEFSSTSQQIDVGDVAEVYKLKMSSAQILVDGINAAKSARDDASGVAALASICLNVQELKSISKSSSVSKATIDCLSEKLDQDPAQTAMMVGTIIDNLRAEEAARSQNSNI
jgi:hypothetical protein